MSTIVTRAGKGSALTHTEVDANFTNLNTDKVEKTGTDPVVISVNSASDALRITQTGTGNALVVEDSTNPDSTPFVIDAEGKLINGRTVGVTGYNGRNVWQQVIQGGGQLNAVYSTSAASPAVYEAARSRSATIGAHTVVQADDWLGYWVASGSDGTEFIRAASITAQVDGTPGTNDMPGRLVFSTTADGASGPTERMRIDSSGNVGIGITPTQKLHVSGNILATGSIDCGTQFLGLATDTATAPSFSFTSDTNTGMFRPGTDQVALTTGGTARLTVTTAQFTGTLPWRGQNGTAAAPAFSASGDTNTGIYFPGADRIGFSEGGVQVGEFDASANFKFNSGYGSVATAYGCRAWVNFNGTGTVAIRASGNVSSITDNGTGDYTVNFTTAMADANYAVAGNAGYGAGGSGRYISAPDSGTTTKTTTQLRFQSVYTYNAPQDCAYVDVVIFR